MNRDSGNLILCVHLFLCLTCSHGGLTDYFNLNGVKTYFGYGNENSQSDNRLEGFERKVPYEVSEVDEKFISQAIELTGVAVSELDACQHRLILKLKSDCHMMNDEMISKLAVGLLNCQSYVEGRKLYPCTEQMKIKDCTADMDSDIWNTYHLMTNRVRAVCYSIRQAQFRGLTEHTVNRLMEASYQQINTLGKISKEQENLQNIAHETIESITQGHASLAQQQQDLQKAQFHGQLQLEDNINRLANEKKLIIESQARLATMTRVLHEKLTEAADKIQQQSDDTHSNHNEILKDLMAIQEKAHIIFQRIEDSSSILLAQSDLANKQYAATLEQLNQMNTTVHSLVSLVGGTKQALEERLLWITTSLGGTDNAIERLYIILWHCLFLLIAMIACAFLNANFATRIAVVSVVPANLGLCLLEHKYAVDATTLFGVIGFYIVLQTLIINGIKFVEERRKPLAVKAKDTSSSSKSPVSSLNLTPENSEFNAEISRVTGSNASTPFRDFKSNYERYETYKYASPTPPLSRNRISRENSVAPQFNSSFKARCAAFTRVGTPCRNNAVAGKEMCYRHERGDSVML